jgi:hypothetical protein
LIEAFTPEGKGRQITTQSISARLLKEVGRRVNGYSLEIVKEDKKSHIYRLIGEKCDLAADPNPSPSAQGKVF